MGNLQDILKEFIVETQENLDQFDKDLLSLEDNPGDTERIASLFRAIHTVKGNSGLFGFSKLETVAHAGENLLSKLRDGVLVLNSEKTNTLLAMGDAVREMMKSVESTYIDGDNDYADLVQRLTTLASGRSVENATTSEKPRPETIQDEEDNEHETEALEASDVEKRNKNTTPSQPYDDSEDSQFESEDVLAFKLKDPHSKKEGETRKAHKSPSSQPQPEQSQPTFDRPLSSSGTAIAESTIRVDVDLLDSLVNLVGELVLTRNQVVQFCHQMDDTTFSAAVQRLSLVTTELQEGIMQTRMQPIGNAWSKLPRLVRDLSQSCGKQVDLFLDGKDTELDKSLIEAIRDPLTHMVRNAIDHGIETPEERQKAGKTDIGQLSLRAYHEGGQVVMDVIDDGYGINTEKLLQKAINLGLISQLDAENMNEREIMNLMFLPGLSTASKVTNISGRGVGMDVVKNNIERAGGTIDVISKLGEGTTFRIHIPLTLAILPALIVSCENKRYAIPQICLVELVKLEKEIALKEIETIGNILIYRLRGKLLPLVFLSKVLYPNKPDTQNIQNGVTIVVVHANDRQYGLVVDTVQDNQEIVVKPLGHLLCDVTSYAGATILGDGAVALILDITNIAERTGIDTKNGIAEVTDKTALLSKNEDLRQLLICENQSKEVFGIMLEDITRLERMSAAAIEKKGRKLFCKYRDSIIQLIDMGEALSSSSILSRRSKQEHETQKMVDVVINDIDGETVGIIIEKVIDVIDAKLSVKQKSHRRGIAYDAAIGDRIVELLDITTLKNMLH